MNYCCPPPFSPATADQLDKPSAAATRLAVRKKMWLKVLTIVLLFQLMLVRRVATASLSTAARMENDTFLYFAYGSNLLEKRIHIQNPTAVRKGIGRLKVREREIVDGK